MKTKTCVRCKRELPMREYSKDQTCKGGFKTICKECNNAKKRATAEENGTSRFPKGTPDDARFSLTGEKKVGLSPFKTKKDLNAEALTSALEGEFPAPRLIDLGGSNKVLVQIKDEKLQKRVRLFLTRMLEGQIHRTALAEADFSWHHVQTLQRKHKGLKELYLICKEVGEEYRRIVRTDAAHSRAVDGVEDPIYSPSGKYLGSRTLYSDRLLELLLKADSPERFNPKQKIQVEGLVLNIPMVMDRAAFKKEAEDAEFEEMDN